MTEKHFPIRNLTILWAFNECALGGLMHAFRIPFTGIFVGGFAVILIGLIAEFSKRNSKELVKATLLVVAVKFMVSPQSPIGAYIAVLFQGIFGALIYRVISNFRIASFVFALVAMFESALQKLLTLTILFGKAFWEALNSFLNDIAKVFGSQAENGSYTLAVIYLSVYHLWGLTLGFCLSSLPKKLSETGNQKLHNDLSQTVNNYVKQEGAQNSGRSKKAIYKVLFIVVVMLGILVYNNSSLGYVILRTLAGVIILFFVINPLLKWLLKYVLKKQQLHSQNTVECMINELPRMYALAGGCWQYCKANFKGISRIKQFAFCMLLISLYGTITNE